MWETIVGFAKKLFGGSGASQIGSRNKSISGNTVGDNASGVVIGDGNTVTYGSPKPPELSPVVIPECAVAGSPFGVVNVLCITIKNLTDRTLHLGNFTLLTRDDRRVFFSQDALSGEFQRKRALPAGDALTFHISADKLREVGLPAEDYVYAEIGCGPTRGISCTTG